MRPSDHTRYEDDVGAYLLGALSDLERQAFERHVLSCTLCRDEVERLRPAADALPRSVVPVTPPPALKASLMQIVEREARDREAPPPVRDPPRRRLARLMPALGRMRPAAAWVSASFLLAVGILTGWGISRVVSNDEVRTVAATVDHQRVPAGSASLVLPEDGKNGAILRVHGLPALGSDRVYQVWIQREGEVVSQSIFKVGRDGSGAAAVPDPVRDTDSVMVTRERAGGASAPSERPIIRVRL